MIRHNVKRLIDDRMHWNNNDTNALKGYNRRACTSVDYSLHDVAGVSNVFSVNGGSYFSSASIFGRVDGDG